MPPTSKHLQTSLARTGRDYAALHHWIDDPVKKNERHDFTKIPDYLSEIRRLHGEEGMREYIEHLREDMDVKLHKIWGADEATRTEALTYYGILQPPLASDYTICEEDIALLRDQGMSAEDLAHSRQVAAKALELAHRCRGVRLDMALIGRGALFHDLGKIKTQEIEHGRLGAELGQALGLPDSVCAIMEKHIRGGLEAAEASELGLPAKDYRPYKLEERIVLYADRLVDIIGDGIVKLANAREAETRFPEILREHIRYGKNEATLRRYLGYHTEIQALLAAGVAS